MCVWREIQFHVAGASSPIPGHDLQPLRQLKGSPDALRQVWLVAHEDKQFVLKTDSYVKLRKRLRTMWSQTRLENEVVMLEAVRAQHLAVPRKYGWGQRRYIGLLSREAILMEWISAHQPITNVLTEAMARGDDQTVRAVEDVMSSWTANIRRAEFTDSDFGPHNFLVPMRPGAIAEGVWVDLEVTQQSPAEQMYGTVQLLGAVLSDWWRCTRQNPSLMQRFFDRLREDVPEPVGGWTQCCTLLNGRIHRKLRFHRRTSDKTLAPPPLTV